MPQLCEWSRLWKCQNNRMTWMCWWAAAAELCQVSASSVLPSLTLPHAVFLLQFHSHSPLQWFFLKCILSCIAVAMPYICRAFQLKASSVFETKLSWSKLFLCSGLEQQVKAVAALQRAPADLSFQPPSSGILTTTRQHSNPTDISCQRHILMAFWRQSAQGNKKRRERKHLIKVSNCCTRMYS